ncbi:MAG: hypothetical protein JNG88_08520, partial [Phycisphaerales bacterium]|nr:hypothetical protein [Phycisphaerales bacterium]
MNAQPAAQLIRKILLVESSETADPAMLSALDALGDVSTVRTNDQELKALASGEFDLIVHAARRDPEANPEAIVLTGRILTRLGRGLGLVSAENGFRWANEIVAALPEQARDAIQHEAQKLISQISKHGAMYAVGWCRITDNNQTRFLEITACPYTDPTSAADNFLTLIRDTTDDHLIQQRINAIEAAGQELVRLDPEAFGQMEVGERLEVLEDKIIRYCRDMLHFDHFVIRVLDPKTNHLDCVVGGGMSEKARNLCIRAEESGQGISGRVAATGKAIIVGDVRNEPLYLPGLEG